MAAAYFMSPGLPLPEEDVDDNYDQDSRPFASAAIHEAMEEEDKLAMETAQNVYDRQQNHLIQLPSVMQSLKDAETTPRRRRTKMHCAKMAKVKLDLLKNAYIEYHSMYQHDTLDLDTLRTHVEDLVKIGSLMRQITDMDAGYQ
eukprot:3936820-Rhodomonas_salina.1